MSSLIINHNTQALNTHRNLVNVDKRMKTSLEHLSSGEKIVRAGPFSSQAEVGNVRILSAPWNAAFLDELEAFPFGSHDDQVDAASGAFSMVAAQRTAPKSHEILW